MADKLMFIHNDDTQSFPFCRLQLVVEIFKHSTSKLTLVPKIVKQSNKENFRDQCNQQLKVPSLSGYFD